MSSTGEEHPPRDSLLKKSSSNSVGGLDTSAEKRSAEHDALETAKPDQVAPVGFSELFRFSTRTEIFLDLIGLVCAAGAGAAQASLHISPLMSLIFGRLTQDFVNFEIVRAKAEQGNPDGIAALPTAAASFRKTSALDATYLVYIGLGMFATNLIYMVIWSHTSEVGAKRLRESYLAAVLRQNIAFFDNVGAGEIATRIETDTHLVQLGISEKIPVATSFMAAFLVGFIIAFTQQWKLSLAMSSMIPMIAITGGLMNKFISKYMQESLEHIAEGGTIAEEVISTIRTSHAFGSQNMLHSLYNNRVMSAKAVDLKQAIWQGGALGVMFFTIYASYALAFQFGTTLINSGEATPGEIVNVVIAILIGAFSLALMAPEIQAIVHARGAAAKLFATIDRVPEIDSADPGGLKPERCEGRITFENIKFNYPSRPNVPIVKDLSLTIEAGTTVALVGASGSGKSTVISLVERFYDPLSGVVRLDGIDLKELNVKWLRSQIGLVSQEPILFATTIRNNVAHGLVGTKWENAPEEEKFALIREACIKANADGFISKLPNGYETLVGERGFLLSGGQKQRIAIARAIVSDPRILLLDEATSALDTQSEGIVQNALDKASRGRTTITIAHRLSTIKDANRIHVMGEGAVLESGTHNELLRDENGPYARLVAAQKLKETHVEEDESGSSTADDAEDLEKAVREEIPLGRQHSSRSLASEIIEKNKQENQEKKKDYSMFYLFRRIGSLNPPGYRAYFIGTCAAICTGMVYPAFGVVYAKALNGFSLQDRHERRHAGDRNALWFFIISILSALAIAIQNWMFNHAATQLSAVLRDKSFKAILSQDIEFFDREENNTGTLTAGLSSNPQKVFGLAGITLGAIIQSIATIIGGSVIGLVFAWKVSLIGIACYPLVISAGYIRLRVVILKDQTNKKAHASSAQLACEAAGSIRTVASLGREEDCCRQYSASLEEPLRRSNTSGLLSNLIYALSQSMGFWVIALIFWYGSILVSRLELQMFNFFVSLMSTVFGAIQAGNVFMFVPDVSSARSAAVNVIELLDSKPDIDASSDEGLIPKEVVGHIRFDDIHFRYPTRPGVRVLRGLSLTVEPGSFVAIVGPSGSGKSTTIQLVERFYDPLAGDVYFDDTKITELNVGEYRKHLALVSQEPTLYDGTIKFNVLLGATKPIEEVTQEEIEKVCADANILEFIRSLPDGFETKVGGKGSQLSGGQKQRIAIARALLRNPKVLLLDEATSALDSQSEKVVQAALDTAARGRTTIAIAHRLSTIQNADCIYFITEGIVSEYGTHEQLLALRGGYYEYVQLQDLSGK
ncbi:P-loop containing nucleoside triphosphate hydrolase protein [Thelephora ganbajun]|uniref:P-loop containing nucleoside triphosphate hydrolase protein n=1 Tax=Thelephora ganbajun TaxID=370292 RepID=A0ACB6ZJR6_THEGA|nr:P-loop containing nucleoside triphosphate hydrolase protein [Thelephora ganbajun]